MKDIDSVLVRIAKKYEKFILDRSFQLDQFDEDSCVIWLGKVDEHNRPVIRLGGGAELTVRGVIFMILRDRLNYQMNFKSTCDNPHCINPRHMVYITPVTPTKPVATQPPTRVPKTDQQLHLLPSGVKSLLT